MPKTNTNNSHFTTFCEKIFQSLLILRSAFYIVAMAMDCVLLLRSVAKPARQFGHEHYANVFVFKGRNNNEFLKK